MKLFNHGNYVKLLLIDQLNVAKAHSDSQLCYKKKCHFKEPRPGQALKSNRISVFLRCLSNQYSAYSQFSRIISLNIKFEILNLRRASLPDQ